MKRKIKFALKSFKGTRPVNQDSLACSYNKNGDFLAIVCDGVGSVEGSEIASKLVVDLFTESFEQTYTIKNPTVWFKDTLNRALKMLKTESLKINKPGISTTLALLIITNNKYFAFNIGDTRIYVLQKDDEIKLCSYDHNYKNYLISKGYKKAKLLEQKNKWASLTNFIDASHPRLARFNFVSGDLNKITWVAISTDGVYSYISRYTVLDIIKKKMPIVWKSSKVNRIALKNKSNDNVSNILIQIK